LRQLQLEEEAKLEPKGVHPLKIGLPLLDEDEEDDDEDAKTLTEKHKMAAAAEASQTLIPVTEETVFLNGTRIPNPSLKKGLGGGPLPPEEKKPSSSSSCSSSSNSMSMMMARIKPKPVYIGDRKGVTFIDIDSQRWWDRAHLAYAFHPKKKKKKQLGNKDLRTSATAVPEGEEAKQPNRPRPPPRSSLALLKNLFNPDNPSSLEYQEWLCNFYPEKDFSSSTFLHCGGGSGYDEEAEKPKNLFDKLGLVNPLHYYHPKEQDGASTSMKGRFPPWVTEEGLREFDTAKLDRELVPNRNRNQKFSYD